MSQVHQPSNLVDFVCFVGAVLCFVGAVFCFVGALETSAPPEYVCFVGALLCFVGAVLCFVGALVALLVHLRQVHPLSVSPD